MIRLNLNRFAAIAVCIVSCWASARAERTLCSTELPVGQASYLSPETGKALPLKNGVRFEPSEKPKTVSVELPLPTDRDFRLYDELAFETVAQNGDSAVTVELQSTWPEHSELVKKRIKLEKGTKQHKFYLPKAGYRTELRKLVLTFHQEPDVSDEKKRSSLTAPIELRNLRLNAADGCIKPLEKQLDEALSVSLPPGFSDGAQQAAERERGKLRAEVRKLFEVLRNGKSAAEANSAALLRLYSLRGSAAWQVEQAGFRVQAAAGPLYGWTGGADKILRDGTFPGTIGGTVRTDLARNESEGIQIALYSVAGLQDVSVHVGEFNDGNGAVLPAADITAAPVGYVNPTAPAYWSEYINHALPDPLLGYLAKFDVEKERFQPVWIDFTAPADQAPGVYRGTVEFRSGDRELFSVPVEVTVRNFQLPSHNSLHSVISSGVFRHPLYELDSAVRREFDDFMYAEGDGDPSRLSPAAQRMVKIDSDFFQLLRGHRIEFHDIYRSARHVIPGWRRRKINEFNTLFCLGYDNDRNIMKNFEKQFPEMRREGTADRAYIYGYDEIRSSNQRAFDGMKKSYGELKKAFPELKTAATALDYSFGEKTDTTETLDFWVVPPDAYMGNRGAAERARQRGKHVWYYPCNWPYPPAANLLLESRATATRMVIGVMPWKFKADGFLYYSTTMFQRQTEMDSLLRKWERSGDVTDIRDGFHGYDGEYLLSTSPGKGKDSARLECWTMVPKDKTPPLLVEFEIRPETFTGGKDSSLIAELRLNYNGGIKTDRHVFEIDPNKPDWQKIRREISISGPVRNMLLAFRLKSPGARVMIRNVNLRQPGVMTDRRITADRILQGGPVLDDDNYCYSMFRSNGDGTLVYPGPDGLLPSIRLKFLRDGIEDYEYLAMLGRVAAEVREGKRQVADKDAWLAAADALLAVDNAVCSGMTKYASEGAALLEFRGRIADLLEQANQ